MWLKSTIQDTWCYGKIVNTTNVSHTPNELIYHQLGEEKSSTCSDDCQEAMGIIFTIVGQVKPVYYKLSYRKSICGGLLMDSNLIQMRNCFPIYPFRD